MGGGQRPWQLEGGKRASLAAGIIFAQGHCSGAGGEETPERFFKAKEKKKSVIRTIRLSLGAAALFFF